jgi:hypothetical protein
MGYRVGTVFIGLIALVFLVRSVRELFRKGFNGAGSLK